MHEDQLRTLIRDAIAQHLGTDGRDGVPSRSTTAARSANPPPGAAGDRRVFNAPYLTHLSHGRFVFLAPTEPDAPCVVEPHVRCTHCGFCQSYGH